MFFEKISEPVASSAKFMRRVCCTLLLGLSITGVALIIGMVGLCNFEHMSLVDAFSSSAMILSGVGATTPFLTKGGKVFAGIYALFSGIAFLSIVGVIFSPLIHRCFHKFYFTQEINK